MEEPGNGVALTVFGDLSLDLRNSSTTSSVGKPPPVRAAGSTLNLRRQLTYRLARGPTEVAESLPTHSPIERSAYIDAGQPKVDIILIAGHRILDKCGLELNRCGMGGVTCPNLNEEDADGAKDGLCRCDT